MSDRCVKCGEPDSVHFVIDYGGAWECSLCHALRNYRWWTVSGGWACGMDPGWLKLGPVSFTWYRWDGWNVEAFLLGRWMIFRA